MSIQSPLIVPLIVEAFVVNDHVRASGAFFRAQMEYGTMWRGGNGQPTLSSNDASFTSSQASASAYYDGVYLKWRLPAAFTRGQQNNSTNSADFLQVPNRWLVVRSSGANLAARTATAWIIESDYVWTSNPSPQNISQGASLYVLPQQVQGQTLPVSSYIGRNVQLGRWNETGHSLGLTAQAPGNNAFASYQPQCNNVFSFVDPLVSAGEPAPQTLSYQVLGWYSNPEADPLYGATEITFATLLQSLGWTLPPNSDATSLATWSLLSGSIVGVPWQTDSLPSGGPPANAPTIAVGHSSVEALTALVTAQAASAGVNVEPELLEAFQLDLIDVLDKPDGAAVLAEKLRASFFQKYSGGYGWQIVDAPNVNTPVEPAELQKEQSWLASLNQAQLTLDADLDQLVALQTQLYVMWWKFANYPWLKVGTPVIAGLQDRSALQAQLDPTVSGTLAQQTAAQLAKVNAALAAVPNGTTADALQQAIDAYASQQGLPATRQLKRSAAASYHLPNNPVVLLAGAGASGMVSPPSRIMCRFGTAQGDDPAQLVSGFSYAGTRITAATAGLTIPQPDLSGVSGVPWSGALLSALVNECFFLDPNNAAAVAAAISSSDVTAIAADMNNPSSALGVFPSGAVQTWAGNPWHPLLLLWQADYYAIAYESGGAPSWTFYEGRYTWNGSQASIETPFLGLQGLIQLAPTAAFNMQARLSAFLANNPYLPAAEQQAFEDLLHLVQDADHWDLLSQALDGFNDQLRLGMPGVFMSPATSGFETTPPLPALLGGVGSYPPALGSIPSHLPIGPSQFQAWRAGQFVFTQLLVIDEWGQALWPIDQKNYLQVPLVIAPDFSPVVRSNATTLTVAAAAALATLEPALAAVGGDAFTLVVNGVGFTTGATVSWNGSALPTTFVSATQLTAQVPASALSTAGSASVTVQCAGASGGPLGFLVAAGPAIAALSPNLLQAGMASSATLPITVCGVGFTSASVVEWNGTALDTDFVSATELVAHLPASFTAAALSAAVTVVAGSLSSPPASFTVSAGACIGLLSPSLVAAGSGALALTVHGVGFSPASVVSCKGEALVTQYLSDGQLVAQVPAAQLATAGSLQLSEQVGALVQPSTSASFVQVPPALLQPAQLDFDLVSASDDALPFGPANPGADPICGWIVPNHLDASLLAFDPEGVALGEMRVALPAPGSAAVIWQDAPGSPYQGLAQIQAALPHFGTFLLTLQQQTPTTFAAFQQAIDETLWTTAPMGAAFDQNLAVLIGRPLAMVRASLALRLNGPAYQDPSWQYTFAPATPAVASYAFPAELGNVAQLEDGLIGYFVGDEYSTFNVVQQAGVAVAGYLNPIGVNGNYLSLGVGATPTCVSMLVDPRAPVHATTGILPDVSVALPPTFVDAALAAMNITFRMGPVLADQQISAADGTTLLMPVPAITRGTWSWVQKGEQSYETFPIAAADSSARLSPVAPVLRSGFLQLASGVTRASSRRAPKISSGRKEPS